ncbi:hypothetical protein MGN70_009854 [Eutypa lata]|nr:hypothetical protein MGN70_009854 [Eutypa lata]
MATLKLDPEFATVLASLRGPQGPPPTFTDALSLRSMINTNLGALCSTVAYPGGVQETNHIVTSLDGSSIGVTRFLPESTQEAMATANPQRAVVFVVGGGMIGGSVEVARNVIARNAQASETQFFGVEYRKAPEHRFPAAVEDVFSTVVWLQDNTTTLNVDPARIILYGPSAGGGVAAGAVLMARDKGLNPPVAGQVLKYPMIDDRTTISENSPLFPHLLWTPARNDMGWKAYLGKERGERTEDNVSPYAAPARVKDLGGLPATYIITGGLDLFRDESATYAARLAAANVPVEFHLYPGLPHAFDMAAPNITATKHVDASLCKFIAEI